LEANEALVEALDVGDGDLTVCAHRHRGLVDEVPDRADERGTTRVPRAWQRGARDVADVCEMADLLLLRGQPRQRRTTQDDAYATPPGHVVFPAHAGEFRVQVDDRDRARPRGLGEALLTKLLGQTTGQVGPVVDLALEVSA
jgi:hypothetical protein